MHSLPEKSQAYLPATPELNIEGSTGLVNVVWVRCVAAQLMGMNGGSPRVGGVSASVPRSSYKVRPASCGHSPNYFIALITTTISLCRLPTLTLVISQYGAREATRLTSYTGIVAGPCSIGEEESR